MTEEQLAVESHDEDTQQAIGDGRCLDNALGLIRLFTMFTECIQKPKVRGDVQRLRVQLRRLRDDGAACDLIRSITKCLADKGNQQEESASSTEDAGDEEG